MIDFTGQTIIVTGAAGNVGQALAIKLSALSANLALADMDENRLRASAKQLGAAPLLIAGADARTEDGANRIAHECLARFSRIDGLANTVGAFQLKNVADGAAEDWRALMDLNALTALRLSQAVLPAMVARSYGRIVHIAAGAGARSFAGAGVYAASKAAVMRITEALSEEHKAQGVTANCVMPGTIDTPQNRAAMPDANASKWVRPDELANVIAFLLSREASAVTGSAVPVTGRL
ncbi:MAG: SDR family NAD(P)-dependent oxidoreductase [Hyphomonadaceae bacterium]|nr:SDR family NAD(P)-dependent oxidoreductase [Hyphomonadaceae bacterium]